MEHELPNLKKGVHNLSTTQLTDDMEKDEEAVSSFTQSGF